MSATSASIRSWLQNIPDNCSPDTSAGRPHKRRRQQHAVKADSSEHCAFAAKPTAQILLSKYLVPGTDEEQRDDDIITRLKRARSVRTGSGFSLSSYLSNQSLSQVSGQISPRKQLQSLSRDPQGVLFREFIAFYEKPKPPDLTKLIDDIELIMLGKGIVSKSRREDLTNASKLSKAFRWVTMGGEFFSDERDLIGHTPSPKDVCRVRDAAEECSRNDHPEISWNMEVHQLVLSIAFRPSDQRLHTHLVNFMSSTQASLIPNYTNLSVLKKVDYTIYVEPEHDLEGMVLDDSSKAAIERCLDSLPSQFFNFTDFGPLSQRPIALSIVTGKPTQGIDVAKLQLGVWQHAHWSFLRHSRELSFARSKELSEKKKALLKLQKAAEMQQEATEMEQESTIIAQDPVVAEDYRETPQQNPLKLPTFIPAIIVQGHQWFLSITIPEDKRIALWYGLPIGTTSSTIGIYQIVCVLQLLRKWVKDTYWPLVREMVYLGWPKPTEEMDPEII